MSPVTQAALFAVVGIGTRLLNLFVSNRAD